MDTSAHCCTITDKYTYTTLVLRQSCFALVFSAACRDCCDEIDCVKRCLERLNEPNKLWEKYAREEVLELWLFYFRTQKNVPRQDTGK